MSVDNPTAELRTWFSPKAARMLFVGALLGATLLPVLATLIYYGNTSAYFGVAFLGAIASTHVVATLYLLTDPDVRSYVWNNPVRMGLAPGVLVAIFAVAFSMPGTAFFAAVVLAVFLYQTWHFGAQNIGVASFVSFCERRRPLDLIEKRAIRGGIFCGMAGILFAMPPTFGYAPEQVPVPQPVRDLLAAAYTAGSVAAVALGAIALFLSWRAVKGGHFATAIILVTSICFFFPMYVSTDFLFAIGMFSTAHGLQYIVFLAAHSASPTAPTRSALKFGFLVAPGLLAAIMLIAHLFRKDLIAVSHQNLPLLGSMLMGSLTMTHFWVDQYLWKMKTRGSWLKARYSFIFSGPH